MIIELTINVQIISCYCFIKSRFKGKILILNTYMYLLLAIGHNIVIPGGYHDLPEWTVTDRVGPKRTFWVPKRTLVNTETDRDGPKRTFVDTETDFLGTETDLSGQRNELFGYKIVIRGA